MVQDEMLLRIISDFGLSQEEINKLSIQKAISYIRFYHEKKYGKSSILFRGFPKADAEGLAKIASANNLIVNSRISPNLTFLCTDNFAGSKTIETEKSNGMRVLHKYEFNIIFSDNENVYDLQDNEFLYDLSVPSELRIAKPLSNFDYNFQVTSFSFESDVSYEVNIFRMTCSCPDFQKQKRAEYKIGDIRRLCKHLMFEYKNRFGIHGQSKLNNFIIDNCYSLKKNFMDFVIEKSNQKVILNYDNTHDWWSIFIEDKKGSYQRYGYSPTQKGFAHNDKPIGIVGQLRIKLDQIYENLSGTGARIKNKRMDKTNPQGCANVLLFIVLVVLLFKFFS
jgi:hypothetical protein